MFDLNLTSGISFGIGFVFMVFGLKALFDKAGMLHMLSSIAHSHAAISTLNMFLLMLGVALLLSHNQLTDTWTNVVTIGCWVLFLRGVIVFFFQDTFTKLFSSRITKFKSRKNKSFRVFNVIFLLIGLLYLYASMQTY